MTSLGVTLALAFPHWGYWSLACGVLAGRVAAAVTTVRFRRTGLGDPRHLAVIAAPLRMGWHVVVSGLGWYVYPIADANLIKRHPGTDSFGYYAMAIAIATLPLDRLNHRVNRVMPGVFSSVQHEKAERERYIRHVSQAVSLLAFPAAFGLCLVAANMVPVPLGTKWILAVAPLLVGLHGHHRSGVTRDLARIVESWAATRG